MMPSNQPGFLSRAHRFLIYFGGIYAGFLVCLTIPVFQRHLIYLHKVKWPLNSNFARPEKYGLAPHKALNVNITTSDDVRIGAWFILSDPFYASSYRSPPGSTNLASPSALSPASISSALRLYPTVLYFHGNAGTRAVSFRVATYASFTTRLGANVLAVDYRGFADSEGTPSEEGLRLDARAAWNWAVDHGADPEDIVLVGQSLGTGVAAQLAQELAAESTKLRGLVLVAPYTSLATLLETYNLGGWIPLLKPLQSIPFAQSLVLRFLNTRFDTKAILPNVKTDIIILHAEDDFDIPLTHSADLFDTLLEPSLPPRGLTKEELSQPASVTPEQWSVFRAAEELRGRVREDVVHVDEVEGFGRISRFTRDGHGEVIFVESKWGGHDQVGRLEGIVDIVGQALKIKRV